MNMMYPLDKAFQHGYYREMVALIRAMFGRALKTNEALAFAVLTGCLRVSKESIFTGLNNFKILSITIRGLMNSLVLQIKKYRNFSRIITWKRDFRKRRNGTTVIVLAM